MNVDIISKDATEMSLKNMKWIVIHFIFLVIGCYIFSWFAGIPVGSKLLSFLQWDSVHYLKIKNEGYVYVAERGCNVAFFPGFPYLWKFLHLDTSGIMVVNILLFIISMYLILDNFVISKIRMLFYLSLPSVFFLYMPYSEALFFFFGTIILVGLRKNNIILTCIGFFLCSITRSAANVFVPAIIIMEIICYGEKKNLKVISYCLSCLLGVGIVLLIQYYQTGVWFGFAKTQKYWGHYLQWPKFPLSTTPGVFYLDASAMIVGVSAIALSIYYLKKRFYNKFEQTDKAHVFSVLYIAGVTLASLAFKGQSMYSLNRYIFPTVFCLLLLSGGTWRQNVNWKFIGIYFCCLLVFFQVFNAFAHIRLVLQFTIYGLLLCLLLLSFHQDVSIRRPAFVYSYILLSSIQIYLLFRFMEGLWVG